MRGRGLHDLPPSRGVNAAILCHARGPAHPALRPAGGGQAAAGAGLDVTSTFVYAHPTDRDYVDRLVDTVAGAGGSVTFVQLRPAPATLEERVAQPSRAAMAKLSDADRLRAILARYDLFTPITAGDLSIDNTDVPPEEAAAIIAAHAGLTPAAT